MKTSIKFMTRSSLPLVLLNAILLLPTALVEGCSCEPTYDFTPAEMATYIRDQNWIDLYVIATLTDEISYSTDDDNINDLAQDLEQLGFTFQNTTFVVKEIVYNRNPGSSELPTGMVVQSDGTTIYETTTETTCCLCGRSFAATDVGKDFLLPITKVGEFLICDTACYVGEERCDDIANELRGGGSSTSTSSVCMTKDDCDEARKALNLEPFNVGDFPTKGCFKKNGQAFFSSGSTEAMSTDDLPGIQERVYCSSSSATVSPPITDEVPSSMTNMLLDPTWTVTEYGCCLIQHDGQLQNITFDDNKQLVEPIPGTSIVLTLKAEGDSDKCYKQTSELCTIIGKLDPGNAYFGSYKDLTASSFTIDGCLGQTTIGFGDEIFQQEQNYLNNWWERKDLEVEWVVKNGGSLELTNAATGNLFAVYKQVCMTKEDCVTAAAKMGLQVLEGDFPSKGCFMKNDMAFWSEGSTSQISVVGLPGVQMRIFCESETTSATKSLSAYIDSSISSAYMDSTAIENADIDSNVGSTTIDSSKNVGLPPTKLSTSGSMVLTVGGNGAILMMAMLLWV